MKKVILVIICLLFFNVYADTYYTDYHLVKENEENYLSNYDNDELKKSERKEIINYEEVIDSEGYYELNKAPSNLIYSNLEDYIIEDYYSNKPYHQDDDGITTLKINKYPTVRFIRLRSFSGKGIIHNIDIYYNDIKINHSIYQTNYDFKSKLKSSHNIVIDLNNSYELNNLVIKVNYQKATSSKNGFMFDIYSGDLYYNSTNPKEYYQIDIFNNKELTNHTINFVNQTDFKNMLPKMSWIIKSTYNNLTEVSYFKQNCKLYKYYSLKKIPIIKYLYDYYERDYVELSDEIQDLDNLSSFIISSSLPINSINISFKDISDEEIFLIVKTSTNTFFKKYNLPKKDIKEEIKDESVIDNNMEENNSENLNDNNNYNNSDDKNEEFENNEFSKDNNVNKDINIENNIIIEINNKDDKETINEEINSINSNINEITNDGLLELDNNIITQNDNEEESVIEKDFDPNYIFETNDIAFNNQKDIKEIITTTKTNPIINTKAKPNKTSKNNSLFIIIIIIICVKLLTLYQKKKSSFVESV